MKRVRSLFDGLPDGLQVAGLVSVLGVAAVVLVAAAVMLLGRPSSPPDHALTLVLDTTPTVVFDPPKPTVTGTLEALPTVALAASPTPVPTSTARPTQVPAVNTAVPTPVAEPTQAPTSVPTEPVQPTATTLVVVLEPTAAPVEEVVEVPEDAEPDPAPAEPEPFTVLGSGVIVTNSESVVLRSGPSRDDAVVDRLLTGTVVDILEETVGEEVEPGEARWFQVRFQSTVGYIYALFVELE